MRAGNIEGAWWRKWKAYLIKEYMCVKFSSAKKDRTLETHPVQTHQEVCFLMVLKPIKLQFRLAITTWKNIALSILK